jgi:hypothetical protein
MRRGFFKSFRSSHRDLCIETYMRYSFLSMYTVMICTYQTVFHLYYQCSMNQPLDITATDKPDMLLNENITEERRR